MKTSIEKLKNTVAQAAGKSDETLEMYIDDAYLDVIEARFPEAQRERANRYLAAHFVVLAERQVLSEAVGPLKRSYRSTNRDFTDLDTTAFGQEYLRLLNKFTKRALNLAVF